MKNKYVTFYILLNITSFLLRVYKLWCHYHPEIKPPLQFYYLKTEYCFLMFSRNINFSSCSRFISAASLNT